MKSLRFGYDFLMPGGRALPALTPLRSARSSDDASGEPNRNVAKDIRSQRQRLRNTSQMAKKATVAMAKTRFSENLDAERDLVRAYASAPKRSTIRMLNHKPPDVLTFPMIPE
jgi:hypothetical protein